MLLDDQYESELIPISEVEKAIIDNRLAEHIFSVLTDVLDKVEIDSKKTLPNLIDVLSSLAYCKAKD
jgi:hypothetical protein